MFKFASHPSEFPFSEKAGRIFLLADENTFKHCFPLLPKYLQLAPLLILPAGEACKTLIQAERCWQFLADHQADRYSSLYVLGGGALCDLGGFCGSTYMRGIRTVLIPTTLLAMIDAAIGGKTGINLAELKNYLGTFSPLQETWVCGTFLKTLADDEIRQGWAEAVKHALIKGNSYFESIQKGIPKDGNKLNEWIKQQIQIKWSLVEQDPFERGVRKVLNLGHTLAHAIESYGLKNLISIKHGDAVAAGIWIETAIAVNMQMLPQQTGEKIHHYLSAVFPKLDIKRKHIPLILEWALKDKKNSKGSIKGVLLKQIGEVVYDIDIDARTLLWAIEEYVNH